MIVEHGGGGSKAAAPVARDILLEAQKRNSAREATDGQIADRGDADLGFIMTGPDRDGKF